MGSRDDLATPPEDLTMESDLTLVVLTGCNSLITCFNACKTDGCRTACFNKTTQQGQSLGRALITCLQTNCPGVNQGDVCYMITAQCQQCYVEAQQTGACAQAALDCSNDVP